jgi:hypothetical protein
MAVKRRWDPPRTGGTPDRWQQEEGHTQAGAKSQGLVAETARTTGLHITNYGDGYSPGSNAGAKELWRFHIVTGFIERFRVDPGGPRGPERSRAVPSGPERAAQRVERNRVHIQDTCEASLELAHSTARSHKHVAHRTRGRARGLRASEELGMRASHAPCCFTRLSIPAEHCGGRSRRSQVSPPPMKQVLVPVTT